MLPSSIQYTRNEKHKVVRKQFSVIEAAIWKVCIFFFAVWRSFATTQTDEKKTESWSASEAWSKRGNHEGKFWEAFILMLKFYASVWIQNITPLPGFLQTFGGTEIGRFSEAFFTSSESPNPYYNNSIESDVESPQPWDFDSLDGPVNMQVGAAFQVYGSETEYDSPINNFSEIMCNDY